MVRENLQVVGMALCIPQNTRNKMFFNLLIAQDYCVSYSRTLMMETAIASAVVENTKQFQGLYVLSFLKKYTFVFAVDDADFAEDIQMLKIPPMALSQPYTRKLIPL